MTPFWQEQTRFSFIVLLVALFATPMEAAHPPASAPGPVLTGHSPWNMEGKPPHLVAHYMPWFQVNTSADDPARIWDHWSWKGKVPRNPEVKDATGRRELATAHYPLIGPYNSWSRAVVRYHLTTAKAVGIQAFLCIWYGPGNAVDRNIPLLLEEAQKAGMKIAICYEEKLNFPPYRHPKSREEIVESCVSDLTAILKNYASHPAYLRRGNLPFIYQFNFWGTGHFGPNYLTSTEWRQVFAKLPQPVTYARQNLDEVFHPLIPGAYVWWTPGDYPRAFGERAAGLIARQQLQFFMSMVCPGFDDTGVQGWGDGPRVTPRNGLATFTETMNQALVGNPELVQVVTWNDFQEGTEVEPTREFGYMYLDALETWWSEKTRRPVNLSDNRLPLSRYLLEASEAERAEMSAKKKAALFP